MCDTYKNMISGHIKLINVFDNKKKYKTYC